MRRGFMLLAVMIGLALAMIVSLGLLRLVQAESAGTQESIDRAQAQLLARSGLDVLASELHSQLDVVRSGSWPTLDEQYTIYETERTLGVIRLLPVNDDGALLAPESAKLDINELTAEQLTATGLMDQSLADRIVQLRDRALGRPLQSVHELANVPGMSSARLFGPLERLEAPIQLLGGSSSRHPLEAAAGKRLRGAGSRTVDPSHQAFEAPLCDVLTVFTVESEVQQDGTPRIDLRTESERRMRQASRADGEQGRRESRSAAGRGRRNAANRAVEADTPAPRQEFDLLSAEETSVDGAADELPDTVLWLLERGRRFESLADVAGVLQQSAIPPVEWPAYFDACTVHPGGLAEGRVNINVASVYALRAIPGISPEQADAIAAAQSSLSDAERATVCWPLLLEILSPDSFAEAVDHMTNRSWCWRVRMAAGEVDAEEPDGPLRSYVIVDVVFDLASESPRVAYLRDVSLAPSMLAIAQRNAESEGGLSLREVAYALDDEIEDWEQAYGDEAADGLKTAAEATGESAAAESAAGSQPSRTPDVPQDQGRSEQRPAGERETPVNAPDGPEADGTGDSQRAPTSTVRRVGRWHGGSSS